MPDKINICSAFFKFFLFVIVCGFFWFGLGFFDWVYFFFYFNSLQFWIFKFVFFFK